MPAFLRYLWDRDQERESLSYWYCEKQMIFAEKKKMKTMAKRQFGNRKKDLAEKSLRYRENRENFSCIENRQ
jgi:hypothetical protein